MCLAIQSTLGSMFKNLVAWSMVLLNLIKEYVFFLKGGLLHPRKIMVEQHFTSVDPELPRETDTKYSM